MGMAIRSKPVWTGFGHVSRSLTSAAARDQGLVHGVFIRLCETDCYDLHEGKWGIDTRQISHLRSRSAWPPRWAGPSSGSQPGLTGPVLRGPVIPNAAWPVAAADLHAGPGIRQAPVVR
jgi:hypothetical protein